MAEFRMPSLGADMDEGTLLEWLVHPGDTVRRGDPIAVVDTAKAAIEVESFADGVLERVLVEPGERVPVGTALAMITAPAERAAASRPVGAALPEPSVATGPRVVSPLVRKRAAEAGVPLSTVRGTGRGGSITYADLERAVHPAAEHRVRASPYARRLARELGVDILRVEPREPGSAIQARDVRAAASAAAPAAAPGARATAPAVPAPRPTPAPRPSPEPHPSPAPGARRPATGRERQPAMREAIARLMARANREIPHYHVSTTIDMTSALAWVRDHNRALAVAERVVPAALLLRAVALTARQTPALNGFWTDDAFVPAPSVNTGVAVSLRGGGLLTPVIRDADTLGVDETMTRLRDLVERCRGGRLRRTELTDGTITVTNLGDRGVESVHGVIYPPQVALVGFGKVAERPWAVDGLLGVRPVVTATLSGDHRASDGYTGARFLEAVDKLLQTPEAL